MALQMTDGLRAAGFASVEGALRALKQLRRRRDAAVDQRLDAVSLGGFSGFSQGLTEEERRRINEGIDRANDLADIERRIAKLEWLLSEATTARV